MSDLCSDLLKTLQVGMQAGICSEAETHVLTWTGFSFSIFFALTTVFQ